MAPMARTPTGTPSPPSLPEEQASPTPEEEEASALELMGAEGKEIGELKAAGVSAGTLTRLAVKGRVGFRGPRDEDGFLDTAWAVPHSRTSP